MRHRSNLTGEGIPSASCTDFGKNCNVHFSELFNQGSSGKGFLLGSKLTERPHHSKLLSIPDNQFPLRKRPREEFKDLFSAFCKKIAPEADSNGDPLLALNPAPWQLNLEPHTQEALGGLETADVRAKH